MFVFERPLIPSYLEPYFDSRDRVWTARPSARREHNDGNDLCVGFEAPQSSQGTMRQCVTLGKHLCRFVE